MNLGLVIYGSLNSLSGGYLYDRKLVEYLQQQGDQVEILSLPVGGYARHLIDNISYRNAATGSENRDIPFNRTIGKSERSKPSHRARIDLLIQDELNHPSLLVANARPHPYPIVSIVHHLRCVEERPAWHNDFYRLFELCYLRTVDAFIFNSKTTKREVERLLRRSLPHIIANPPTDRLGLQISGQEIIERAQSPEFRVLFLGNVIKRKGLHNLLEAVRLLPTPVHVDVVGALGTEPAYSRQMQKSASGLGAGSQVRFLGPLDNEPLISLMKKEHILVIPSSYEGFGIAYLEGMGFGLPAIGTSQGAAREVISDGTDGFVVPPGSPRILAERLRLLARDRQRLIQMGLAARERFLRQPSWEHTGALIRMFLLNISHAATKA